MYISDIHKTTPDAKLILFVDNSIALRGESLDMVRKHQHHNELGEWLNNTKTEQITFGLQEMEGINVDEIKFPGIYYLDPSLRFERHVELSKSM